MYISANISHNSNLAPKGSINLRVYSQVRTWMYIWHIFTLKNKQCYSRLIGTNVWSIKIRTIHKLSLWLYYDFFGKSSFHIANFSWSILGAHTIISSKNIHKVTKTDYVWFYGSDVSSVIKTEWSNIVHLGTKYWCCPGITTNSWTKKKVQVHLRPSSSPVRSKKSNPCSLPNSIRDWVTCHQGCHHDG